MQIQSVNSVNSTLSTKIKEKEFSQDEFQASVNEIKNKEEKDKKSEFQNEDLNLSTTLQSFTSYAQQKLKEDQFKKNEETMLTKLFNAIDNMNKKA